MPAFKQTWSVWALLLAALLLATGCQQYELRGKVVPSDISAIVIVDQNDPRLQQPGLEGAVVSLTLDPNSMSPKEMGSTMSDLSGTFTLPVSEVGAGMLEYEASILSRLPQHQPVRGTMPLPSSKKRLLIMMTPGRDTLNEPGDVLQETIEIGRALESR